LKPLGHPLSLLNPDFKPQPYYQPATPKPVPAELPEKGEPM
jgi:hypothetical protein